MYVLITEQLNIKFKEYLQNHKLKNVYLDIRLESKVK